MRIVSSWVIGCISCIIFSGCYRGNELTEKIEKIRGVGDTKPSEALLMLDSLSGKVRTESKEKQVMYDLLETRLKDKAYIPHTNDLKIREVVDYYESENDLEKLQQAYYYAGSVYRDLQDTPRAIKFFNYSVDCAERLAEECDSVLLRNAYSNLCLIEYNVQDYEKSLAYAQKEFKLSELMNNVSHIPILHIGSAYLYLDSISASRIWLGRAYEILSKCETITDGESLYSLLYNYAYIGDSIMARKCYELTKRFHGEIAFESRCSNLGAYYLISNQLDSAIINFERITDESSNLFCIYDASRELYNIHRKNGDTDKALIFADMFLKMSDSIDFNKRQKLASNANNQFQYHRDRNEEIRVMKENEDLGILLIIAIIAIFAISITFTLISLYKKKRNLEKLISLSDKMNKIESDKEDMILRIKRKEKELEESKNHLHIQSAELEKVKKELSSTNDELENARTDLKEKERALHERMEQNKAIMNLIHMAEFEKDANDLIIAVRQAAGGNKKLTSTQWAELYKAVDELNPDFKGLLVERLGTFSAKQMQVCYLMRIGLSKTEIQNLTDIPRATVWRWIKKYSWISTT